MLIFYFEGSITHERKKQWLYKISRLIFPIRRTVLADQKVHRQEIISGNRPWTLSSVVRPMLLQLTTRCNTRTMCCNKKNKSWERKQCQWIRFAKMAQDVLPMPATSASGERSFCIGRYIFGNSRMSLRPETVEALVCLRSLLKSGSHHHQQNV